MVGAFHHQLQMPHASALAFDRDVEASQEIKKILIELIRTLPELLKLKLPRPSSANEMNEFQLHVFCDASEKAYTAAIYAKITDDENQRYSYLLSSKTKITPIKAIAIPK